LIKDADGTGGGGVVDVETAGAGVGTDAGTGTGAGGVATWVDNVLTNDFIPSPGDVSLLAEVVASYTAQSEIEGIYVTTVHLASDLQRSRHCCKDPVSSATGCPLI
jgi:hypothetical protein